MGDGIAECDNREVRTSWAYLPSDTIAFGHAGNHYLRLLLRNRACQIALPERFCITLVCVTRAKAVLIAQQWRRRAEDHYYKRHHSRHQNQKL
jgi:hypothetical protein